MKNSHLIFAILCLVIFTNCRTTIKIGEPTLPTTTINLKGQPLTIAYQSTDLTKNFMISVKNHLCQELQLKGVNAQLETARDKLPSSNVLFLNVENEQSRKIGHAMGVVVQLKHTTIGVELKNTEGVVLRKKQIAVRYIYDSEQTFIATKIAKQLSDILTK